jgi:hypothetical protein
MTPLRENAPPPPGACPLPAALKTPWPAPPPLGPAAASQALFAKPNNAPVSANAPSAPIPSGLPRPRLCLQRVSTSAPFRGPWARHTSQPPCSLCPEHTQGTKTPSSVVMRSGAGWRHAPPARHLPHLRPSVSRALSPAPGRTPPGHRRSLPLPHWRLRLSPLCLRTLGPTSPHRPGLWPSPLSTLSASASSAVGRQPTRYTAAWDVLPDPLPRARSAAPLVPLPSQAGLPAPVLSLFPGAQTPCQRPALHRHDAARLYGSPAYLGATTALSAPHA